MRRHLVYILETFTLTSMPFSFFLLLLLLVVCCLLLVGSVWVTACSRWLETQMILMSFNFYIYKAYSIHDAFVGMFGSLSFVI